MHWHWTIYFNKYKSLNSFLQSILTLKIITVYISIISLVCLCVNAVVCFVFNYRYFKFPYENIQEVHKRRYLLHPIALEVFNSDGRNFLLAFSKGLQNKVYEW